MYSLFLLKSLSLLFTTNNILDGISEVVTAVGSWIVSLFTSIVAIFYDSTTGFTFVGYLLLVAFALMLVWGGIKFIKALVKRG